MSIAVPKPHDGKGRLNDRGGMLTDDAGASPFQLLFLRRVPQAGVFAAGLCRREGEDWPRVAVAGADFFAGAVRLSRRALREVFPIAEIMARDEPFLAYLPEPAAAWEGGLHLAWGDGEGTAERRFLAETGQPDDLARLLRLAPAEAVLRIAAAAIAAWRREEQEAGASPPRSLDRFLRLVHKGLATGGGEIEKVWRVGAGGMLLAGRLDGEEEPVEAALVALSGRRIPLALPLPATRTEPAGRGFALFGAAGELRAEDRRWWLELAAEGGERRRIAFLCPEAPPAPEAGIAAALALAAGEPPELGRLYEEALSPAIDAFWAAARQHRPAARETLYGEPPRAPQVSLIVPLYGRIDFLHHQIARFSNDPELRAANALAEILYVLDDPPLEAPLRELAGRVHEIYGLPFRILCPGRRLGYSGANNLAAERARGGLLLLLNSDVLPIRARWVGALAKAYRAFECCGVLGCRLLYEDGSLQHAGMTFRRSPELPEAWSNEHPAKGLPAAFDPHSAPARVPAVTGACLMIERALYRRLGGLSEEYVRGDFEDSDLCLKAHEAGWASWYTPEVELYHLERQSMRQAGDPGERRRLVLYNMWKHGRKWREAIPQALEGRPPRPTDARPARTGRRAASRR